jgi:methyl coenzyme M reductase subunit C-like uncharacterized protein (methanogenesis marker protein 7)
MKGLYCLRDKRPRTKRKEIYNLVTINLVVTGKPEKLRSRVVVSNTVYVIAADSYCKLL